jgi:hypothetical protein
MVEHDQVWEAPTSTRYGLHLLHQVWAAPTLLRYGRVWSGTGCTYHHQVWSGMDEHDQVWAAPTTTRYGQVWSGMVGYGLHLPPPPPGMVRYGLHQVWSGMGCTYAEQVWQEPTLNRYGTYTIISRYVFRIYFLKVGRADGAESELEHPP